MVDIDGGWMSPPPPYPPILNEGIKYNLFLPLFIVIVGIENYNQQFRYM